MRNGHAHTTEIYEVDGVKRCPGSKAARIEAARRGGQFCLLLQAERILTARRPSWVRRGTFTSVAELKDAITLIL